MSPMESVRCGKSRCWVIPILCAISITLSWPTLVERRTKAQLTESAVWCHKSFIPPSPSAALIVVASPKNLGTLHG